MKAISLLGSTGSIGRNTLCVIGEFPEDLRVIALAGGRNLETLAEQAVRFRPQLLSIADAPDIPKLQSLIQARDPELATLPIVHGPDGARQVASQPDADVVVCAISGSAGLLPALTALQAGKQLALATKEALVMAGELMMGEALRQGMEILPVDSEHNGLHQCLRGERRPEVRRLILTASGGPFRTAPLSAFDKITPEQALRHPTWQMGRKISIDSATLMNKGLEVIEAHWLFGTAAKTIDVVIHPQSIVHSLVELIDGSVIAQLGVADMRAAIQYVLTYPERRNSRLPGLDLTAVGHLDFETPDPTRFPCLRLAFDALGTGGTMPAVLNAANEVAVAAFLQGAVRFTEIPELIARTMDSHRPEPLDSLETVLIADQQARERATGYMTALARG